MAKKKPVKEQPLIIKGTFDQAIKAAFIKKPQDKK